MNLRRVVYTSIASEAFDKRQLLDMLHQARSYNAVDEISGVLMHREGEFFQVIEGESTKVEDLLERIQNDPRHNSMEIIHDDFAEARLFPEWSMGCADFDQPELAFLPGVRGNLSNQTVSLELNAQLPEVATHLKQALGAA